MYKVEKGVPLPPKGRGPGRKTKYPLMTMEVGDSFKVPLSKMKAARVVVSKTQRSTDRKFATRILADGFGVWRVA